MTGRLDEKKLIAEGTLYTKFTLNEEISFEAGQFFKLTFINPPYTDERGNSRFLGFINSPTRNKIIETTTRLGPSAFKRYLNDAPLETEVEIGEIGGEMLIPKDSQTPWVIITGGIGIVPYMSMFRKIKENDLPYNITLIYSNTKTSWAIFMDELTRYSHENQNFKFTPVMTQDPGWQGEKRRIDENFLKEKLANPQNNLYYVSGTPRFVPTIVTALKKIGATQDKMKFEIFTGY